MFYLNRINMAVQLRLQLKLDRTSGTAAISMIMLPVNTGSAGIVVYMALGDQSPGRPAGVTMPVVVVY